MTVGTWPVIQQPSSLMRGAPGQELAVGHQLIGKTSRSAMPSAIAEGWHMSVCQSFAPGHNVHWIQVREARESDLAPVECTITRIREGASELAFGFVLEPTIENALRSTKWAGAPFAVHNEETLRRLAALRSSRFAYFAEQQLLEVTNSALRGSATFYPTYCDPTECRYPGTPSRIGALTQVVVDGALGSVSGVWEL